MSRFCQPKNPIFHPVCLGREYPSTSTHLKRVLTQRWVLWVLKWVLASASTRSEWVLVFVRVFAEYLYDVSCLRNQIKFTYARSGVPQTALVSAFVVEWAKNRYIGLFYMLQSILKSSNKPYTCCWGSLPMWTESFCCVVAVGRQYLQCRVLLHRGSQASSSRTRGVVCLRHSGWVLLSSHARGVMCCCVVAVGRRCCHVPAVLCVAAS